MRLSPMLIAAFIVEGLAALSHALGELLVSPDSFEVTARLNLLRLGLLWSSALLFAAGWTGLARRSSGRTGTLLRIVAFSNVAQLAGLLARELVIVAADGAPFPQTAISVIGIVDAVIFIGAAVLFTIATSAWRMARLAAVVLVAVPVVATVVLVVPATLLWLFEHRAAMAVLFTALKLASLGACLLVALRFTRTLPPPPPPSFAAARGGFSLAGNALWLRLMIALGVMKFGKELVDLAWSPLIAAAIGSGTLIVFAWGVLRAASAGVTELPRARLVVGAGLVAWCAGIQLAQPDDLLELRQYGFERYATTFEVAAPLAGLGGMVLVVSAVLSLAAARSDDRLREHVLMLGGAMVVCHLVSVGLTGHVGTNLVVAAVAGLASVACLATVCSRTARSLQHEQVVPSARALP